MVRLFSIGFTQTSAEHFFTRLKQAGVQRVLDVRLHNVSQLAGFAKRDDLRYFLEAIGGIGYEHRPDLAPTAELLDRYRKRKQRGSWAEYASGFRGLMQERAIEDLPRTDFEGACLLCSEHSADQCHRRLVTEYLNEKWGGLDVHHL
jgi:uncharacterized protein (DUF488 family)